MVSIRPSSVSSKQYACIECVAEEFLGYWRSLTAMRLTSYIKEALTAKSRKIMSLVNIVISSISEFPEVITGIEDGKYFFFRDYHLWIVFHLLIGPFDLFLFSLCLKHDRTNYFRSYRACGSWLITLLSCEDIGSCTGWFTPNTVEHWNIAII